MFKEGWMEERKKMLKTRTSGNSEILLVLINLKRVFKWGCLKMVLFDVVVWFNWMVI